MIILFARLKGGMEFAMTEEDRRAAVQAVMAPLLSDSETTSAMTMISELRKQRVAAFLSRGAMGQEVSFFFVTFFLDKQKESKGEERCKA